MAAPLTPKPTRKAEALARAPPTIASRREEDAALRKWPKPRYRCASCILETKAQVGSTAAKAPAPRTNPNTKEAPTAPKPHTHPPHECDGRARDPDATAAPPTLINMGLGFSFWYKKGSNAKKERYCSEEP